MVYDKQARPAPPKPPPQPRTWRNEWRVRFAFNDGKISSGEEKKWLVRWWQSLQPTTRQRIAEGKLSADIESSADTPGSEAVNDRIAKQRQAAITDALQSEVGVTVKWGKLRPIGDTHYATDDPKEKVRERALRRAVISVEEPQLITVNEPAVQQVRDEAERRYKEELEALGRQAQRAAGSTKVPAGVP